MCNVTCSVTSIATTIFSASESGDQEKKNAVCMCMCVWYKQRQTLFFHFQKARTHSKSGGSWTPHLQMLQGPPNLSKMESVPKKNKGKRTNRNSTLLTIYLPIYKYVHADKPDPLPRQYLTPLKVTRQQRLPSRTRLARTHSDNNVVVHLTFYKQHHVKVGMFFFLLSPRIGGDCSRVHHRH